MGLSLKQKTELDNFIDSELKKHSSFDRILSAVLTDGEYKGRLEKTELLDIFNALKSPVDRELKAIMKDMGIIQPEYSSDEIKDRKILSEKALDIYISCFYDHHSRLNAIDDAFETGRLNETDRRLLNMERAALNLVTDMYGGEDRDQLNIEILEIICSKGIDPDAPSTPEMLNQISSKIYNMRLIELVSTDFAAYSRYSDKELADHWPEVFEKQLILNTLPLSSLKKNPYISTELLIESNDIAALYAGQYPLLHSRMLAILNPCYAEIDPCCLFSAAPEKLDELIESMGAYRLGALSFLLDIKGIKEGRIRVCSDSLFSLLKDKTGCTCKENMAVFDETGTILNEKDVPDAAGKYKNLYAVNLSAGEIVPVSLSSDSVSFEQDGSIDETAYRKTAEIIEEKLDIMLECICVHSGDYINGSSGTFSGYMSLIGRDIAEKNLDKDIIFESISNHISDETGLSKEEYCQLFKSKGYNIPVLSDEETAVRRNLSIKAAKVCIDYSIKKSGSAFCPKIPLKFPDNDGIFNKRYSDIELVENWIRLNEVNEAEDTDAGKQEREIFFSYYSPRLNIIGSKYYQYGCEALITDQDAAEAVYGLVNDNELIRLKQALISFIQAANEAMGRYIVHLCKYADKGIIGVVDSEGEIFDSKSYGKTGWLAVNGKNIVLLDKQNRIHHMFTEGSSYPPIISDAPALGSLQTRIAVIGLTIHNIKASNKAGSKRKIQIMTLRAQKALMLLLRDRNIRHFEERFKECIGNLCACIIIQKMILEGNIDGEAAKQLISRESQIKFNENAVSAGLIDAVAAVCRENIDRLPRLEPDDFIRIITDCKNELAKKAHRVYKAFNQAQYISFRDNSINTARKIKSAFLSVTDSLDKDWFFNCAFTDNDFEELESETQLKSMRIREAAVNALTLALMLNIGYNPSAAVSNDAFEDRVLMGRRAMDLIRNNDVYTIREELGVGLMRLNNFVNDKLTEMEDYSPSEISRSEYRPLLSLSPYLRYMAQEYENCQTLLSDEDKINIPLTDRMIRRGAFLRSVIDVFTGLYHTDDGSYEEITEDLRSYFKIQMLNKYIQRLKELPENKEKKFDEIIDLELKENFEKAFSEIAPEIVIKRGTGDSGTLQKIHEAILDDSLKDNLNISFILSDKSNKIKSVQYTLDTAIRAAMDRELLNKKIDTSLMTLL